MSLAGLNAFRGANEKHEIETFDEFVCAFNEESSPGVPLNLKGWTFQDVDFSMEDNEERWSPESLDLTGAVFLGGVLPRFITPEEVRQRGAVVLHGPHGIPFKLFRAFLYTAKELQQIDTVVYHYYLQNLMSVTANMYFAAHDCSITDALYDYIENKSIIGFMGGHSMKRGSDTYKRVVLLARALARAGILIATGGGPGAMEAANLGGYLMEKSDEQVDEAIQLIQFGNERYDVEFNNKEGPLKVIERFGWPKHTPSLGIPTWKYGHEPPNIFATFHAKYFSNAIREDGLIQICNCGIIYTPGAAGTRQEIFQDACRNHYSDTEHSACPMVFFSKAFWEESGVYHIVKRTSQGKPYHDMLLLSDSQEEIIQHIIHFRDKKGLPVLSPEELQRKFWMSDKQCPDS